MALCVRACVCLCVRVCGCLCACHHRLQHALMEGLETDQARLRAREAASHRAAQGAAYARTGAESATPAVHAAAEASRRAAQALAELNIQPPRELVAAMRASGQGSVGPTGGLAGFAGDDDDAPAQPPGLAASVGPRLGNLVPLPPVPTMPSPPPPPPSHTYAQPQQSGAAASGASDGPLGAGMTVGLAPASPRSTAERRVVGAADTNSPSVGVSASTPKRLGFRSKHRVGGGGGGGVDASASVASSVVDGSVGPAVPGGDSDHTPSSTRRHRDRRDRSDRKRSRKDDRRGRGSRGKPSSRALVPHKSAGPARDRGSLGAAPTPGGVRLGDFVFVKNAHFKPATRSPEMPEFWVGRVAEIVRGGRAQLHWHMEMELGSGLYVPTNNYFPEQIALLRKFEEVTPDKKCVAVCGYVAVALCGCGCVACAHTTHGQWQATCIPGEAHLGAGARRHRHALRRQR